MNLENSEPVFKQTFNANNAATGEGREKYTNLLVSLVLECLVPDKNMWHFLLRKKPCRYCKLVLFINMFDITLSKITLFHLALLDQEKCSHIPECRNTDITAV